MGFIGYEEDFEEYQETAKVSNIIGTTGTVISSDQLADISEEDLKIIKQTRLKSDPYTVYMQSDAKFYDNHYNKEPETNEHISEDLLKKVKAIRRIYKNYRQYMDAMQIRDDYFDALVEKYGGEERFELFLKSGMVTDWLPPRPIYSTSSPDYQLYLQGGYEVENGWDDELFIEIMKEMLEIELESRGIKTAADIGFVADVETNPLILARCQIEDGKHSSFRVSSRNNNSFDGVTTNDLNALQDMITSWLAPDRVVTEKNTSDMFSQTAEAIRERYYTAPIVDGGGLAKAMDEGFDPDDNIDWNQMVTDSVSGRPMTRKELYNRQFVRFLAENGWNELRLMRHFGVGSSFEIKLMENRRRANAKAKKKAASFMNDILGESFNEISSIDQLDTILFDN